MRAIVSPSTINGTITAAASKSAMQRACAAALIRSGITILNNAGKSADDQAALNIIQQLGATIEQTNEQVIIQSNGIKPVTKEITCGESGLSVRMFTSIAATSDQQIKITGSGSLLNRPLNFFDEVLPALGVLIESKDGYLPLLVHGPMVLKDIIVDGSLSSQYLTGILFAYSAANASNVTIRVTNLNSKPYIDLTLGIMKFFGLKTPINNNYREFYFDDTPVNRSTDKTVNYTVESDWSGAAFLLVAGAVAGNITVKGLDVFSAQADKAILQALMDAGTVMNATEKKITVRQSKLKAFHLDAKHCPDLFPPLVALAAYCEGTTVIEGVHRLTHKESNRALTLQAEFAKMGIEISLQDDLMMIKGGAVTGVAVHSRHDHRIAMACAVAALNATGATSIEKAEAVNKSYPQFYEHLQLLGASVSLNDN
jgi:3-phosphoshikimate 1-carboxyvinyltransferase